MSHRVVIERLTVRVPSMDAGEAASLGRESARLAAERLAVGPLPRAIGTARTRLRAPEPTTARIADAIVRSVR